MYAIVEISGQQFKIEQDQQIYVHRLDAKEGAKVNFDRVLLLDKSGEINVGSPVVKGAKVTAKVLEHLKGDKVIVFKKKRRKGYRVKNGHRQHLTKLEIIKIGEENFKPSKSVKGENSIKSTENKKNNNKAKVKKPATKKDPVKNKKVDKKVSSKKTEK